MRKIWKRWNEYNSSIPLNLVLQILNISMDHERNSAAVAGDGSISSSSLVKQKRNINGEMEEELQPKWMQIFFQFYNQPNGEEAVIESNSLVSLLLQFPVSHEDYVLLFYVL